MDGQHPRVYFSAAALSSPSSSFVGVGCLPQAKTRVLEEDAAVLEKYSRADEAKIKELSLQIERLQDASTKATRELQNEALETQALRIGLDKASAEFQRFHNEQQQATREWQAVIAQMEVRDAEIGQEAEQFEALRSQTAQQVGSLPAFLPGAFPGRRLCLTLLPARRWQF
jgi:hypothetical protein